MYVLVLANVRFPNDNAATNRVLSWRSAFVKYGYRCFIYVPLSRGAGHDYPDVIAGYWSKYIPYSDYIVSWGIWPNLLGRISIAWKALYKIISNRPDIIYIYQTDSCFLVPCMIAKLLKIPYLVDVVDDNIAFMKTRPIMHKLSCFASEMVLRLSLKYADRGLFISKLLSNTYGQNCNKTLIVPCLATTNLECLYEGNWDGVALGYYGTISLENGLLELFEAVDRLNMSGNKVNITVAGPIADNIIKEFNNYKTRAWMNYVGWLSQEELITEFLDINVLVMPKQHSYLNDAGMPTKLAEYLLSRRLVITTRISDLICYLSDDDTIYVTGEGVEPLCMAILKVIDMSSEDKCRIANNGYEAAKRSFTVEHYVETITRNIADKKIKPTVE